MLHGNFFPTFNDNDGIFGSPYHRSSPYGYHTRNPMMSYDERKRRAEIERYNHWKQQELLRQQRKEEELRRQRATEAYLRRLQEVEQQEQLRRQQQQQQRLARLNGHRQYPEYRVVRGPDGCLYRVPVGRNDHYENGGQDLFRRVVPPAADPPTKLPKKAAQEEMLPADDESIYEDCVENSNEMEIESTASLSPTPMDSTKVLSAANGSPRRSTVVVEDVPEDEIDDEAKSFWRNRIPGPGESWMEPIQ